MRWLFVPGLNCRAEIWEGADRLEGVEPITMEWPTTGIDSMDDAAGWLAEEVEQHRADGVVGHSLGGTTALHLYGALQQKPLLPLVVVDSFMVQPHPMFRNHVWEGPIALRERIRTMLDHERPRYTHLREVAMAFEEDEAWIDAAIRTGARFIYGGRGEDDGTLVARRAGVPAHAVNRAVVIPGTSHFLMLEQPDAFYAQLAALLNQHSPGEG